MLKYCI